MNWMKSLAIAAALSCAMPSTVASAQGFRGSVVRIDQRGDNNGAAATQHGDDNRTTITQRGSDQTGVVRQNGDNNSANLRQRGADNSATIVQTGDNNRACLNQRGRGLDATIVQNGNDRLNVLQGADGRVITAERTIVHGRAVYQCR
jgi:hypothetical protein